MARRTLGSILNPSKAAVDLRALAKVRRLDAGTDPRSVVSSWLEAYPTTAVYSVDEAVVGESELLGTSFVQGYAFSDDAFAEDFIKAFDGCILPPRLWKAYVSKTLSRGLGVL